MARRAFGAWLLLGGWFAAGGLDAPLRAEEMRTWIDKTGKYKIEAEIVAYAQGKVTLKKKDGKTIELPVGKLSKVDREYVYKFHNPEYGKRRQPKRDDDEETEESSDSDRPDPRERRRRPGRRQPAETSETDAEPDSEETDASKPAPQPGDLLGAAKQLFGLEAGAKTPPGSPTTPPPSSTPEEPVPLDTGPVTVTAAARWGSTPIVVQGAEVLPLEIVLSLSGGPSGAAFAYGKLTLGPVTDEANQPLELIIDPLQGDPRQEFIPFRPARQAPGGAASGPVGGPPPGLVAGPAAEPAAPPGYPGSSARSSGGQEVVLVVPAPAEIALVPEVVGSLTLKAGGQRRHVQVAIPPADGPLSIPEEHKMTAFLSHAHAKSIKVAFGGEIGSMVGVGIESGAGTPIPAVSRTTTDTDGQRTITWTFASDLPSDAQLRLESAQGLQDFEVPIEAYNITIPERTK